MSANNAEVRPRLVLSMVLVSAFLTTVGLAAGWYAAWQTLGPQSDDAGHAGHGPSGPVFGPTALANLGVEVEPLQPTSHTVYERIPAVVVETPFTRQPIYAPISGRVDSVSVVPGQRVAPGDPILVLIRDALPRPDLTMTSAVLQPASEELHRAVASLREAKQEIEITSTELERFSGPAAEAVPRQKVIHLQYELGRAKSRFDRSRAELEKHGFAAEQVESVANGGHIPHLDADSWKRALDKNGLWPASAGHLYDVLPVDVKRRLWSVSSIGELSARGLDSSALAEWLESDPSAGERFPDIAALIQRGHSVADVRRLHALGALDPVITLRAPTRDGVADWDVHSIDIKIGARVEAGESLIDLIDASRLYLVTEPSGGEKRRLLAAVQSNRPCRATPLIRGTGPVLENLQIRSVTAANRHDTVTTIELGNTVVSTRRVDGMEFRTWALRPGLKYDLRIPSQSFEDVYVVPSGAVITNGPETVVYLPDGDTFRSLPVEVSFSDHEFAVIANNKSTQIFPGDIVVVEGAFAISLALSGGDAVDAHHGHSH